ncbi:host attachment protein [Chitiniphilus purpureus]|uniref:Host attachment protein n=1 Tax=Chitiniphilus purpureus TaxID=2981137 RepID=A0ABY6DMY4_9NEIS|nr:host attachment protein [Chitiniphilus sp. CD1]UXY14466.1 host attachment protein [Chitiniphilus sp. CD1]
MTKTWILAADASRARIFELDGRARLREIEEFEHPQGRAQNRELNTDAEGRYFGGGQMQGHSAQPRLDAAQHEAERFSRSLGGYLEHARVQHRFDRLCLFAPPKFLGLMRSQLSKDALRLVEEEVPKDIAQLAPREIEDYLRRHGTLH